ncbi:MAG: L-threonylcarbamoyladenylate synthase [Pseudomonadota bacterium]
MTSVFPSTAQIERAAGLLRAGKLVAFPTETVYGLGADATNDTAVRAIFAAKGRPSNNPLIVHVASFDDLLRCADSSKASNPVLLQNQLEALKPLWPGPLSVVVPKAAHICEAVSAGGTTVALRIPRHPTALRLITACGFPVAAPSANPSSYISPTTAQHVRDSLGDVVADILDGGPCTVGIESTVLSLVSDTPTVLRPGAITAAELSSLLRSSVRSMLDVRRDDTKPLLSPGLLAKHYSPRTPVVLLPALDLNLCHGRRIGAVVFSNNTELAFTPEVKIVLSEKNELTEVAAKLFAALRELDILGLDSIVVDTCEPIGLGAAIMDRLLRAAQG